MRSMENINSHLKFIVLIAVRATTGLGASGDSIKKGCPYRGTRKKSTRHSFLLGGPTDRGGIYYNQVNTNLEKKMSFFPFVLYFQLFLFLFGKKVFRGKSGKKLFDKNDPYIQIIVTIISGLF